MFKIINNLIFKILFLLLIFSIFNIFTVNKIEAATLSLLPSPATVSVGNIVSVKVFVNTVSKSINNAEAIIEFPVDMLEVVSMTKGSSIFTLWVEEPNFSNTTGKITFNGGVPTPGYIGQSGYIATITFKAKKQGTASVIFSDGAVRENDGLGTDVLTSKNSGVIQINAQKEIEVIEKPEVPQKPIGIQSNFFTPYIRTESIQSVVVLEAPGVVPSVDYYTMQIDNNQSFKVQKDELIKNNEYYLPVQNEGNHTLAIVAFGKDGNYKNYNLSFISPHFTSPVLSLSSKEITNGESVIIYGKTDYPNKQVNIILEFDGKEIKKYIQTTGADGSFSVTTDKIKTVGTISIWAETIFSDTVKSGFSEKIYLKVNETAAVRVTLAIAYPLIGLILIIILLLIILLYLGWHKYFALKNKIERESKEMTVEVHKAMLLLKEELNDQLKSLEKIKIDRNLNEKEEAIFNEIKDNIDSIDNFVEKKLKKLM